MVKIFRTIVLLLVTSLSSLVYSQGGFSHEVGAFVGGVAFQSDFGVRHDFDTNIGNTGFSVGLVHYLNFSYRAECNCYTQETYFNDHFKLRSELSYNSTNLNHIGEYADKNSIYGQQLRAMKGYARVTDIGMQLEFYPWSIREFAASQGAWAPFVGLGAHFSIFKNGTYSDLGPLGTLATTYPKYLPSGYSSEGGTTFSVVASVGTRYKLAEMHDLFAEVRWQYYFSDWVDGLNPDRKINPENKTNDWNAWFNVGYIYYLD